VSGNIVTLTPSSITVGSDPTTTVITPSSITTTDAFLESVVLRDVSGDIITLDYGNEFLQLQTQLYQFISMCLGFGRSPNMQSLNAAYSTFLSNIQSKYGNQYQSLPWLYNPNNIASSLLFYNPNLSDFFWIFFNSLAYSGSVYQNWYSLTPFSVAPYNSYTVPPTTTDASGTVSANANRAVFNIFFYNEGTGYYTPGATYPNANTFYKFTGNVNSISVNSVYRTTSPYGVCGTSTVGALSATGTNLNYTTTVDVSGTSGSSGALGAISQGVFFSPNSMPQAANTRYRSQQFFNVTGSIKDLLGSNAGNPNCFAYYDANYLGTNSTGYRPLDIWCVSGTQTISNSTIIYQYLGFILPSATPNITISGSNILFKNCVFNVLGRTAGVFSITGSNVVFDGCIFRNLTSNETWNYSATPNALVASSQLTTSTILVSTALSTTSSSFYFINNYINFNVNDAIYYSNGSQYFKNILSISTGSASTQAQNYYVCNNTLESTWCTNTFDSSNTSAVMTIQSTLFSNNTGTVNVYYQENTHLAQENYILDVRGKDYPDLYIAASAYVQQTNVTIYFLDRNINEGSNFLKVLLNYASEYILSKRTSTTPFLYYNIV